VHQKTSTHFWKSLISILWFEVHDKCRVLILKLFISRGGWIFS